MARKKAVWCDTCIHYNTEAFNEETGVIEDVCKKGHKPYFYLPKLFGEGGLPLKIDFNSFGYKRRCDDYVKIEENEEDNMEVEK